MSTASFHYQDPFPLGPDTTEYEHISSEGISTIECDGETILKIAPEAIVNLSNEASKAICFKLRTSHLKQVAAILDDPDASDNDRMVALLCHNNDLGDGWEREGEDPEYFREYAVKWSYPMGMNIIFYVMTH